MYAFHMTYILLFGWRHLLLFKSIIILDAQQFVLRCYL